MTKEQILNKWRETGFLDELKRGGVIEWRCAKSMDLVAEYILDNPNEFTDYGEIMVTVFVIIRRCLTKSPRMNRVIYPEELLPFLKETTFEELIEFIKTSSRRKVGKQRMKYFENFIKFIENEGTLKEPIMKSLSDTDSKFYQDIKVIRPFMDVEAEICSWMAIMFSCEASTI